MAEVMVRQFPINDMIIICLIIGNNRKNPYNNWNLSLICHINKFAANKKSKTLLLPNETDIKPNKGVYYTNNREKNQHMVLFPFLAPDFLPVAVYNVHGLAEFLFYGAVVPGDVLKGFPDGFFGF